MCGKSKNHILLTKQVKSFALLTPVNNFLFCLQNLSSGTRATESTVYQIGSITKTFTALLMGKLLAERKLRLWDPLAKFLPGCVM